MSNPWGRQRDESGKLEPILWYQRFELYRQAGPSRKLLTVVNAYRVQTGQKESNYTPGSWRKMSERWDWQVRAEAWDEEEIERVKAEFRADCDAWRANRFKNANRAREKAEALLAFPVTRQTRVGEDGATYIIEPVSSQTLKDAISILKTADELARITTRETLPKVETDITSDGSAINFTIKKRNDAD